MNMITRRHLLLAGAALASLAAVTPAFADADPAEILKPPALGDMALGADEGAKVVLVEYASATCPHCAAFHKDVNRVCVVSAEPIAGYGAAGEMQICARNCVGLDILNGQTPGLAVAAHAAVTR